MEDENVIKPQSKYAEKVNYAFFKRVLDTFGMERLLKDLKLHEKLEEYEYCAAIMRVIKEFNQHK